MDIVNFVEYLVNHPGIVMVTIGLVEVARRFGLKNGTLLGTSLAIGTLLGASSYVAENGTPADFAGWFATIVLGLLFGLVASGIVDATGRIVTESATAANVTTAVATGDLTAAKAEKVLDTPVA